MADKRATHASSIDPGDDPQSSYAEAVKSQSPNQENLSGYSWADAEKIPPTYEIVPSWKDALELPSTRQLINDNKDFFDSEDEEDH